MARDSVEVMRMRGAMERFAAVRDAPGRHKEFRSAAEGAPFTIHTMGLGAGIATLGAKEGEGREFAGMLAWWLLEGCPHSRYRADPRPRPRPSADDIRDLLTAIAGSDRSAYRTAQIEAIGFAVWLKRLAQAFCEKGES